MVTKKYVNLSKPVEQIKIESFKKRRDFTEKNELSTIYYKKDQKLYTKHFT